MTNRLVNDKGQAYSISLPDGSKRMGVTVDALMVSPFDEFDGTMPAYLYIPSDKYHPWPLIEKIEGHFPNYYIKIGPWTDRISPDYLIYLSEADFNKLTDWDEAY